MRVYALVTMLCMICAGTGVVMSRVGIEDPFTGEFESFPLRTLVLTSSQDMSVAADLLQQWASAHKYKSRISSPSGQPGSILVQIWNEIIVVLSGNRLGNGGVRLPGLNINVYWNGDKADEMELDIVAQQLNEILSPFGTIQMTSAPRGTSPRKESTNLWRRR